MKLGCEAPNSKLVKVPDVPGWSSSISHVTNAPSSAMNGNGDECRLLDFESLNRPLVVNFGSATWPPFINQLPAFRRLVEDFSDVADFLLVYIDEAHPSDGWVAPPMGPYSFNIRKHQNLEERLRAACTLIKHFPLPPQCQLVADCMDNNANIAFGVSNERVCIVQQRKTVYLGGKGPFFYNLNEVRQWLEQVYGMR